MKKMTIFSQDARRKVVSLVVSTAMCAGLLVGCGAGDRVAQEKENQGNMQVTTANVNPEGFPIVNEPITLTVYGNRDQNQAEWEEMFFLNKYEEMTNIHLELQEDRKSVV